MDKTSGRLNQPESASEGARIDGSPSAGVVTGDQTAKIRGEIELTRAQMSGTIDALQERLDPERIKEEVKGKIKERAVEVYDSARITVKDATIGRAEKMMEDVGSRLSDATHRAGETAKDAGHTVIDFIRENPVALTLIGAGVGMLAMTARRGERSFETNGGYYAYRSECDDAYAHEPAGERGAFSEAGSKARETADRLAGSARETAERAAGTVRETAHRAREKAGNVTREAQEQFHHAADRVRTQAREARDNARGAFYNNPLAVGVAALAAGAFVGFILPSTRVESEYLGEARDEVVESAKSMARDTAAKVRNVAEEAGRTIKQEAENQGLTG
ncbi:MAG: DUF3618 domain-containing protein [Bryobacteraceae bacterium]|nr:DUF3618 domain-containing protein [Bryobacteraceae bacterium]